MAVLKLRDVPLFKAEFVADTVTFDWNTVIEREAREGVPGTVEDLSDEAMV